MFNSRQLDQYFQLFECISHANWPNYQNTFNSLQPFPRLFGTQTKPFYLLYFGQIWTDLSQNNGTQMHLLMHKGNENFFEMHTKSNQCESVRWMRKTMDRARQAYQVDEIHSICVFVSHSERSSCSWFMQVAHTLYFLVLSLLSVLAMFSGETKKLALIHIFVGQNVTWMNKKW